MSVSAQILEVVAETSAPKIDYESLLENYGSSDAIFDEEPEEEEEVQVSTFSP